MKKRLSIILSLVLVLCAVLGYSAPSFAMENQEEYVYTFENLLLNPGDTTWQEDYYYTLDDVNHSIVLSHYNGAATNLVVPKAATIGGVNYNTKLADDCSYFFSGNETLESISFDDIDTSNVTDMSCMFYGCDSLKI